MVQVVLREEREMTQAEIGLNWPEADTFAQYEFPGDEF